MEKTICIWGDSDTWGAFDYEGGGWVERLKKYFWGHKDFTTVYNLGVDGDTSRRVLKRFDAEAATREPDTIIFAIGVNDSANREKRNNFWVPEKEFENNLHELVKRARIYTDNIMFVGLYEGDESKTCPVPWSKDWFCYTNENIEKYDEIIRIVAKNERVQYINVMSVITKDCLDEDGVHLNSRGHEKIFDLARETIENFTLALLK